MPAFLFPQMLLMGLFVPRSGLPGSLQALSAALPFTYAYEALARAASDTIDGRFWWDVAIVAGCVIVALVLGATTLRRRTR